MSSVSLEMAANPRLFFDTDFVRDRVDAESLRRLSLAGAFVRQRARHSVRPRRRVSRPGEPPSSHNGRLRQGILFGLDPGKRSVVIGPRKLNIVFFGDQGRPLKGLVPQVLEFGGAVTAIERQIDLTFLGKGVIWVRADLRSKYKRNEDNAAGRLRKRTVLIAARPYMRPALDQEAGKLPEFFVGLI